MSGGRAFPSTAPIADEDVAEPLRGFVAGRQVERASVGDLEPDADPAEAVLAYRLLQGVDDYRSALRRWFDRLRVGGHLIVVVPHAFLRDRRLSLPSPWDERQRRLYTPASLLGEVEEALEPNSYRVRWLGDLDRGYDYAATTPDPRRESDVALVVERIPRPAWTPDAEPAAFGTIPAAAPPYAFEPERTRIETGIRRPPRRILVLKLDHLGDLIMARTALRRLRGYFADAHIDLVTGSWNVDLARALGVADRVIAFDAFPRNSTEVEANVEATLGLFRAAVAERYDLAIDLRTDTDTRRLLRHVDAAVLAGIGSKAHYPFLTIALPLDHTRNEAARPRQDRIDHGLFSAQGSARRGHFSTSSDGATVERDCAIVWGPFLPLDPGDYIFDFFIDFHDPDGAGLLSLDIAIDGGRKVAETIVSGPALFQLPFRVERPDTRFEARIWAVEGQPAPGFTFYGGNLIRQAPGDLLHQSEYSTLMVELVRLRLSEFDMLEDVPPEDLPSGDEAAAWRT